MDETPEVAAALAGTLWAKKKQKDKGRRGEERQKERDKEKKRAENTSLGKFQSSRKHKRRKR